LLLLITLIILQILGLVRALEGAKGPTPLVSMCSPIFQPYGITVLDGNCNIYHIEQNFLKGVGCILMPGIWQKSRLKATVAGTALTLIFETIHVILLTMIHSKARWRGMKMRRPWCSMFSGPAILGLLLVFGIQYATTLPPGNLGAGMGGAEHGGFVSADGEPGAGQAERGAVVME